MTVVVVAALVTIIECYLRLYSPRTAFVDTVTKTLNWGYFLRLSAHR